MTSSVGKGDVDIIIAILQQQYVERYFYHTEKYIAVALAVAFPVVGNTHSGTINLTTGFLEAETGRPIDIRKLALPEPDSIPVKGNERDDPAEIGFRYSLL